VARRRLNPQQIWDSLSPSQKAALCCHSGVPLPLYTHLNFTVASIRALARRGLWDFDQGKATRLGKRVLQCADISEQIKAVATINT
jgi:hypothetical protein